MKISYTDKLLKTHTIIPCYEEELNANFLFEHTGFKNIKEFKAELGEIYSLISATSNKKVILVGLGKKAKNENNSQSIRKAVFFNLKLDGILQIHAAHLDLKAIEQLVYGASLAYYNINKFKETSEDQKTAEVRIYTQKEGAIGIINKGKLLASSTMNAMDLVNLPSNIKTPYYIAEQAVRSGAKYGFKTKVIKGNALEKNKLHAVYAVGKASANPPAFIIMEYKPKKLNKKAKTIGLIGKGISFDTGGISIKPAANMHYMKCDMAGGATVISMMEIAAQLQLDHHIVGIVPVAENAVGSNAYRPGDVLKTYSGKHIEVIDTDAEGRLILADALSYMVKNYAADTIIDLATLTGSCVATLGYFAAGLFTTNDKLASSMYESGINSGDKVWRLPMWDEYKSYMNSDIADIKNLSSVPVAGATTAAKFLEFFTEKHESWVHLDIAGVSFTDNELYKSRTATGYGIRLLTDFILKQ
jgi:leucyl aminopeptidase